MNKARPQSGKDPLLTCVDCVRKLPVHRGEAVITMRTMEFVWGAGLAFGFSYSCLQVWMSSFDSMKITRFTGGLY